MHRGIVGRIAGLLVVAAMLAGGHAHAGLPETPRPRQFTVADGLPSNRINDIAQDRAGYLWLATSDGLARFDGVSFRIWRVEQGLRDNFVWSLAIDAQDRVWIGTRSAGLAMLDARRERFTWYDATTPGVGATEVWCVAAARDGDIWFGTASAGLHRLHAGRVERFVPRPGDARSLPDTAVRKLEIGRDGRLWVGTANGVAHWDGAGFVRDDATRLPDPAINGLAVERDGALWIGTPRGLVRRDRDGSLHAPAWTPTGGAPLQMLLRDREDTHWFDVPEGLGVESEHRVVTVPLYSSASRGLVRPAWVGAHEDHEGGLWFASNTHGLWYLPPRWRQFSVLSRRIDDPATLANAQVRGIAPGGDGTLWLVGSGGVLDRFDSETGEVEHVAHDVGQGVILDGVLADRDGRVWISYLDGLARFDPPSGRLMRWSVGMHDGALPGESHALLQDRAGRIWLGGEGGVQLREPGGRVLASLQPGDGRGLPRGAAVHDLELGPGGVPWLATSVGLLEWSEARQRLVRVAGTDAAAVHGLALDAAGEVWLARFGAVERYRLRHGRLALRDRLDADAGFPRVAPSGITVDANGIGWATSVRGLVRVDPVSRRIRVYGVRDGLPSQEFAAAPVARPGDGRILVGTPEGLVVFDPAVVRPASHVPQLRIESVDVRRGDRRIPLSAGTLAELRDGDRDLRVRARLVSFNNAGANAYRFRLAGFDRGWVDVGADGERVFSQLPAGRYRLQVIARGADQVWSAPQSLEFSVRPPWWRTGWAYATFAVVVLLALATAALVLRNRLQRRAALQRIEHERRLAQEASDAKTRFLATFGHEVRTPMTGVLGMTELLADTPLDARQRGYLDSIRTAGEHLLRLLNDALDLARIDSGHLEIADEPFDLHRMLDEVAALTAPLAGQRGLAFALAVAPDVPRAIVGDCSRLRQILLNLLGNAGKFTEHGSIRLRVARHGDRLRFSVSDTGPGLSREQAARLFHRFQQAEGARTAARYGGSGLGLAISAELADAMGGRISVESVPGAGATFHVDLPLREAVSAPVSIPATPAVREASPLPSLSVLLVEDDATVAAVVRGLLEAQGHRVKHVAHGLAALAEATVAAYDIALLDLDLPGIDGFAVARQLRAQGFRAPMVAVTARADAASEPTARAAGFDGFLRKPVTGAMLGELLRETLAAEAG